MNIYNYFYGHQSPNDALQDTSSEKICKLPAKISVMELFLVKSLVGGRQILLIKNSIIGFFLGTSS